ncbi:hypothetical protein L21SP4_00654 [Kiritimatiella glycovorans]|uniref:Uncharacterized protein n=1 Tax=Kiritimatiella glycovorans TaxID=1307763 RepID=A0A0G3ECA2_9BACT|nr:hypothetical protein L21SP4_00654 [Kiritimatiella glycovorans]
MDIIESMGYSAFWVFLGVMFVLGLSGRIAFPRGRVRTDFSKHKARVLASLSTLAFVLAALAYVYCLATTDTGAGARDAASSLILPLLGLSVVSSMVYCGVNFRK